MEASEGPARKGDSGRDPEQTRGILVEGKEGPGTPVGTSPAAHQTRVLLDENLRTPLSD